MVLTTLTTMTGFGCLVLVDHAAVASMGELAASGVLFCLAATMLVLPAILHLQGTAGQKVEPPKP
jgi:predicted RND superfamily exporter protein